MKRMYYLIAVALIFIFIGTSLVLNYTSTGKTIVEAEKDFTGYVLGGCGMIFLGITVLYVQIVGRKKAVA